MEEWRHSSTVLDFGTRWRGVVTFTALPLYPTADLDDMEKKNLVPPGNLIPAVQPVALCYTD
jgi:hypothetical protein